MVEKRELLKSRGNELSAVIGYCDALSGVSWEHLAVWLSQTSPSGYEEGYYGRTVCTMTALRIEYVLFKLVR